MAVKIQIKRGTKAGLPTFAPGEYGLATDTKELFVGTASGNVQIATLGSDGKIPEGQLPSMDYLPTAGGTMTGAIAMGGNKITGLAAPTKNTDAARKQDVDAKANINSPTFTGTPKAPSSATDYTTARIRNIRASTTDLTAGSSSLNSGELYFVYE